MTFDRLHHSPLLRSQETAEFLVPLVTGETAVSGALARVPGPELLAEITGCRVESLALVGHEPWLSELAFWLVTAWGVHEPTPQPEWLELDKGGVIHLAGAPRPGGMRIVALYDVCSLRRLGRD